MNQSSLAPVHPGEVLLEEFERIHVEFGSQIIQGAVRQIAGLLMIRRAPGTLPAGVDRNCGVSFALIGDIGEDVRQRWAATAGDAAGRP